jgi:hypothetical protein
VLNLTLFWHFLGGDKNGVQLWTGVLIGGKIT